MTASQPPEPPGGSSSGPPPGQPGWGQQPPPPGWGQQPPPGYPHQPPPGAPGYGQGYGQAPSWSAPPPGQPGWGQQPPPGYSQQPPPGYGPPGYPPQGYGQAGAGGSPGASVDVKRLRMADFVVAGGTLLYFVLALLPWRDYGDDFFGLVTLSGFESSSAVTLAFVLFLLATAWALLPAFYDPQVGFPRAWITVGLAALGFLLTLVAWIGSFDAGFSIWALLGLLTAAAILLFSLFTLLPQLRDRPALPGALAGAAQWANQQAPVPPTGAPQGGHGYGAPPPPPGPDDPQSSGERPATP